MDWQKQFEEKFSHCFNIGVVPDDITKDKIIHFISSLLQQKDQELSNRIKKWSVENGEEYCPAILNLINFIKQ